jgi:trk system potassium uptake protein TrkH
MALSVTAILVVASTVIVLVSERWEPGTRPGDRVMTSLFQVVSASTTDGFNSVDIGAMSAASLTVIMMLMFIGASPGSTGGGIKTTSFGLIAAWLWGHLRGRDDRVEAFRREVPADAVTRAFAVASWFAIVLALDLLIMAATEKAAYLPLAFEITSALGNTGLSMGVTAGLSDVGRFLLIVTMFVGRVGPLAITRSIAGRVPHPKFRYVTEELHIG